LKIPESKAIFDSSRKQGNFWQKENAPSIPANHQTIKKIKWKKAAINFVSKEPATEFYTKISNHTETLQKKKKLFGVLIATIRVSGFTKLPNILPSFESFSFFFKC
jgi:hypothetical protein